MDNAVDSIIVDDVVVNTLAKTLGHNRGARVGLWMEWPTVVLNDSLRCLAGFQDTECLKWMRLLESRLFAKASNEC